MVEPPRELLNQGFYDPDGQVIIEVDEKLALESAIDLEEMDEEVSFISRNRPVITTRVVDKSCQSPHNFSQRLFYGTCKHFLCTAPSS